LGQRIKVFEGRNRKQGRTERKKLRKRPGITITHVENNMGDCGSRNDIFIPTGHLYKLTKESGLSLFINLIDG
jgi:hypothetical protein